MSTIFSLVTGATSDIGSAISHTLADAGAQVLAVGRDRNKLAQLAADRPGEIQTVAADLTEPAAIERVRAFIVCRRRLDVLVLGSGIYERSSDPDALVRQFAANVKGPYALIGAVLPFLIKSKGLMVCINSTQGLAASPGVGQFAATQHAMRALMDSIRAEVNVQGVRVTTIFLGRTATARQAAIFAMEERQYFPEQLIQPQDVADVVVSLAKLPRTSEVVELTMRPRFKSS